MKNYSKTIEKTVPRLDIRYDEWADSPREWDNLGYFITCDSRHSSPDKNEAIENIVRETGGIAKDQADHMKLINKQIKDETGENVLAIYPVTKYDHSGISYSLGTTRGFDHSNNGFYIVTDKTQKVGGTPKKLFEKVIKGEIDAYNSYVNGEVYAFTLYDEKGDETDSCSGFYNIEDIRHSLPEEWKTENMHDYLNVNT